jgi:asparagine synthase (glutamine-hydrolysing)
MLGHRRLAIIDLSDRGAQPMTSECGSFVLTFNGEIYNYRELRSKLEAKGHHFQSDSDSEVLLRLYQDRGDEMLADLRGMFAFALWDGRREELTLARDPFGIKPLYYADDGRQVFAASEVKGLLAGGGIDRESESAGHVGFFIWGHVPEPFTLYRGIRAVPAGTVLRFRKHGSRITRRYADLGELLSDARSEREPTLGNAEALREALLETVQYHLVADVDVGIFLSAGIDSTALTALAAELGGRIRTVTLGFEDYRGTPNDETRIAESIASRYKTEHQTVWISRGEFQDQLDHLLDRMDQPSIDGVNSFFVARAAAQAGLKVVLSGLGGDELFAGYPSFAELPALVGTLSRLPLASFLGRGFRTIAAPFSKYVGSPKYAGLLEYGSEYGGAYLLRRGLFLPWELPRFLDRDFVSEGWQRLETQSRLAETISNISNARFKISALESSWYMRNQLLRDTDWASMSHSIEVRVPLVDWKLWRDVAPLIRANPFLNKQSLAAAPRYSLPKAVTQRAKTGFSVPTGKWIRDALENMNAPRGERRGLRGWAKYVYRSAA